MHRSPCVSFRNIFLGVWICASVSHIKMCFQGTGFDEEAALLGAGREFALMKTASGKVRTPELYKLRCMCVTVAVGAKKIEFEKQAIVILF